MVTNTNYPLPPGHTITVTVSDGSAHVEQLANGSIAAMVTVSAPAVFGPYMIPHTFRVQDSLNATVAVAAADSAANIPSAAQAAMLDNIPAEDPLDGETIWADDGVLKIAGAP